MRVAFSHYKIQLWPLHTITHWLVNILSRSLCICVRPLMSMSPNSSTERSAVVSWPTCSCWQTLSWETRCFGVKPRSHYNDNDNGKRTRKTLTKVFFIGAINAHYTDNGNEMKVASSELHFPITKCITKCNSDHGVLKHWKYRYRFPCQFSVILNCVCDRGLIHFTYWYVAAIYTE